MPVVALRPASHRFTPAPNPITHESWFRLTRKTPRKQEKREQQSHRTSYTQTLNNSRNDGGTCCKRQEAEHTLNALQGTILRSDSEGLSRVDLHEDHLRKHWESDMRNFWCQAKSLVGKPLMLQILKTH